MAEPYELEPIRVYVCSDELVVRQIRVGQPWWTPAAHDRRHKVVGWFIAEWKGTSKSLRVAPSIRLGYTSSIATIANEEISPPLLYVPCPSRRPGSVIPAWSVASTNAFGWAGVNTSSNEI